MKQILATFPLRNFLRVFALVTAVSATSCSKDPAVDGELHGDMLRFAVAEHRASNRRSSRTMLRSPRHRTYNPASRNPRSKSPYKPKPIRRPAGFAGRCYLRDGRQYRCGGSVEFRSRGGNIMKVAATGVISWSADPSTVAASVCEKSVVAP